VSHLTKTKMSLVIWLNIVIIVARSVRLLSAHMREDANATCPLHCQWCQTCRKRCFSSQHLFR